MFKNSIMIGMRFLLCTAIMAAIYFIMTLVVVRIFTPIIIFGEGLCAMLCSYMLSNILLLCEEKSDDNTTDENVLDVYDEADVEDKHMEG